MLYRPFTCFYYGTGISAQRYPLSKFDLPHRWGISSPMISVSALASAHGRSHSLIDQEIGIPFGTLFDREDELFDFIIF